MDMEVLAAFKNRVMNLSDSSTVAEWQSLVQALGDMYKLEVAEQLTGATTPTLATERSDADTDIASLKSEFNIDTSAVKKPN